MQDFGGEPELNSELPGTDDLDVLDADGGDGYVRISDDIAAVIEKAAAASTDFEQFRKELEKLAAGWPADRIAGCLAVATFRARALCSAGFDGEN
jgi:hypothetical protein